MTSIARREVFGSSDRSPRLSRSPAPVELENGDHLAVGEFLRRYEAATHVKKAQLIEGIVHMPSPVRADLHGEPDGLIQGWLFSYSLKHPHLRSYPNTTLVLDGDNAPQPDAILCSQPTAKGRVWLNEKGYLCGAPELICEITSSSSAVDLHEKKRAYARAGVSEYIVWLTAEKKVLWLALGSDGYAPLKADAKGKITSAIFPSLILNTKALLKLDRAKVIAALEGN
jgi:Uma2 family endonuclease